ncbi:MAG TPA: kelch repeat-containing protein, partial [Polyangiaceae bacterium]|nr:kelch repeat-containing protein [Polyangiaceae bacterium]
AEYHGKLYVTGGLTPDDSTAGVWVGDLATGKWSSGPAFPDENLSPAAAVFGDRLFANGGDGVLYRLSADGGRWDSAGALGFPRMFHQMVAADDGLWVVGGVPGKDRGARIRHVEHVLDTPPAGVVWKLEAVSSAKNRQGVFLEGEQLYVFGGNNSLAQHDFGSENFVDTASRLDLGSLEWKSIDAFPARRQSMQTVVAGDEDHRVGYAMGGFGFAGDHLAAQRDVFSYDFQSGKWAKQEHGLSAPRSQFGVAAWGGAVWILGGLDYDDKRKEEQRFRHPTAVLRMGLAAAAHGFVDAGFQLRERRRAFAGAQLGSHYYLTGGIREDFQPVTSCEVVDLEHEESKDMPCPKEQRLGGELVALKGKLYLVGGSVEAGGAREPSAAIDVFDPATNQWSTLTEKFPFASSEHVRAFAFHDDLLLYTAQHEGQSSEVALLDVAAIARGATTYAHLEVSAPARASANAARPSALAASR